MLTGISDLFLLFNFRFCTPLVNCPALDEAWEDQRGVPVSAILFGGRRPSGVPLVYQAVSWEHGVFIGNAFTFFHDG